MHNEDVPDDGERWGCELSQGGEREGRTTLSDDRDNGPKARAGMDAKSSESDNATIAEVATRKRAHGLS